MKEVDFTNLRYREALGLSQEPALSHCVIDVFVQGCCDFLCFFGVTGFHCFSKALAVESDYFYREEFELAVGVERAVEYVHYVGHDFEV